jgi:ubiquinone/menaquinone biosynthesis C-methylase UbiE
MTEPTFKPHPIFARLWIWGSSREGDQGITDHRRELLDGLSGRVLELGCGNGMNFPHYPETVEEVIAVEPEPTLRAAAEQAAADAPVPVRVVEGVADRLPAEDESLDGAVASLVLCSVPEQAAALGELRRVLRPGGELRFYEHVHADSQPLKAVLVFADRTFWPHVGGGCHPTRHTAAAIERAGFEIERCRRFMFSPGLPVPRTPHIIGLARRP